MSNKYLIVALSFVVGIIFIFSNADAKVIKTKVLRVVDGDTIKINYNNEEVSIRFVGIDTAETHYQGKTQGYWGDRAAKYLSEQLPPGTEVEIETPYPMFDKYGRILGTVFKDGEDINKLMLEKGLAVIYSICPCDKERLDEYVKVEEKVVDNEVGLFNPDNLLKELPFEFRLRISGRDPDKYIGDYDTKVFYPPEDYEKIDVAKRVFFMKKGDGEKFGFTWYKDK